MGSIRSRRYFDAPDLDRLIAFSEKTTGDRLPHPTYVKPGDVVWMSYDPRFDRHANIKLWFDGADLVAYAWFEPPLQVSFDISPDSAPYDGIGAEILGYAEDRRQELLKADEQPLPKALAMLGHRTVSAIALTGDRARNSLLERHGYHPTERFSVFHSRSLTDGPIEVPKLSAGLRLRHATDDDIDERAEVHRASWSV